MRISGISLFKVQPDPFKLFYLCAHCQSGLARGPPGPCRPLVVSTAEIFDVYYSDFTISYLATDDTGEDVYLSLLSDWDLDAAFISASNPCLRLKVDLKPFEPGITVFQ